MATVHLHRGVNSAIRHVRRKAVSPPTCTCDFLQRATVARSFSTSYPWKGHENPLGLPLNNAPPQMPRRTAPGKRQIPGVKQVVVVASGKGGVGKSSVAVNLALALSTLQLSGGKRPRVGILDLDIFGPSIPKLMHLEGLGEPNLTSDNRLIPFQNYGLPCMSMGFLIPTPPGSEDNADVPIVWRGMMVMKAVQQLLFDVEWRNNRGEELDLLVIDTPPGTGDVSLSLGQLVKVDGAVIVSTPQRVALVDTRKGIAMFRKLTIPIIGAVLNMSHFYCTGCSTPHFIFGPPDDFVAMCQKLNLPILSQIPLERDESTAGVPSVLSGNESGGGGTADRSKRTDLSAKVAFLTLGEQVWEALQRVKLEN